MLTAPGERESGSQRRQHEEEIHEAELSAEIIESVYRPGPSQGLGAQELWKKNEYEDSLSFRSADQKTKKRKKKNQQ